MRERKGNVLAFTIPDTKKITLQSAVYAGVLPGSTVYSDDFKSYTGLSVSFIHESVCHSVGEYVRGMAHANGIESVWAVLMRGFNGVYHKMSFKHLDRYICQFTFRLNRGNVKIHTLDRVASMAKGMFGKRLTYKALIGK